MSEKSRFELVDDYFSRSLELNSEERIAFIDQLTATDPEIAKEVTALLNQIPLTDNFLGPSAESVRDSLLTETLHSKTQLDNTHALTTGDEIGPFSIIAVIGQGLRSMVYLAERKDEQWTQKVAIKVMTPGISSDDVYRRFLSERQILTSMRHRNIASLLDGGVTPDGLPYFVLEYIDGLPINEYCNTRRLSLDDRVQLFREVCEAVAHAHKHLVVHRDIKPSNILVDQDGRVKLLDFGIAKLLQPDIVNLNSMITEEFSRPMTPAYSSPEQISGGTVTTATDVYQLGLLLSEILSNAHPIRKALGIEGNSPPMRPPGQLQLADSAAPPYPLRLLRGDLDWIALKALEPKPEDRYGSAAELLADINAFLREKPVAARSSTLPYLIRKFVRRRPGLALATGLGAIALVGYILLMIYFNTQLARERTSALESAARAEEIKDMLAGFITSPDPYQGTGADTRISDLLETTQDRVLRDMGHRPEIQAELLSVLADSWAGLNILEPEIEALRSEIAIREELDSDQGLPIVVAKRKLAKAIENSGEIETALALAEDVQKSLITDYPNELLEIAIVTTQLGDLHYLFGRREVSSAYLREAVNILDNLGTAPLEFAHALNSLGYAVGDYEIRQELQVRAHEIRVRHQGPTHPATLIAQLSVAGNLTNLGRFEESLDLYAWMIPEIEKNFGPDHQQTFVVRNNQAFTYMKMGDFEKAVPHHRELLELKRAKYGDHHRTVGDTLRNLGTCLGSLGRYEEAISVLTEASEIYDEVNLPGNPSNAYPHISLAEIYAELGQVSLMEAHASHAIDFLKGNAAEDNPRLLKTQCLLGDAKLRNGDPAGGVKLLESTILRLSQILETKKEPFPYNEIKANCQSVLANKLAANSPG